MYIGRIRVYVGHTCVTRWYLLGPIVQSVVSPTADPGVTSSIPVRSHTFMEIDHSPPSPDSRRVVVSYKRKYVHEVLVTGLVKLTQEKLW